jgi:L-malate glycosyltransferase
LLSGLQNENNLIDRIHFLGKQERVVELLSLADLFLLPSEKESFGLVALEAMACEIPVIATRAGGIPEVVTHGKTGFLSAIGDLNGMAEAGLRLLRDDELLSATGKRAREDAVSRFSQEQIMPQYEQLYQRVMLARK